MKLSKLLMSIFVGIALIMSVAVGQEVQSATAEAVDTTTETSDAASTTTAKADESTVPAPEATDDSSESKSEETVGSEKVEEKTDESQSQTSKEETKANAETPPVQAGPLVDLLGPSLLSLEMIDETTAQFKEHYTTDALRGKKVIGLYFSADWCGPCRQFTPELVSFYNKMNSRRGKKDQFEIVWVSRCRDVNSFGQYFTQMNWVALPPQEAAGQRGQMLGEKYKVKGIPSLVLLDDLGQVITTDARNKIPQDKAGIGFPWRSPLAVIYSTVFPRSLRLMVKSQVDTLKAKLILKLKSMIGLGPKPQPAAV